MPIYRFKVPQGSVEYEKREKIAVDVTNTHCGSTLAPRHFVHVFFDEQPEGSESDYPTRYYLDAINRAGRPQEVKDQLLNDLLDCFTSHTGVLRDDISGRIGETPAAWAMEGGQVLPEPGQETAEWYAEVTAD
jgi:phenylpyruvate tautomerase PptA (4-oxalocrotonate tautomerase family)